MAKSDNLRKAKETKNDEFYTKYEDIQSELNHYEEHFKGKTVLCNADDPFESNFCKFFLRNFNYLGLKRLICTSYHASNVVGTQLSIFDLIDDDTPIEEGHGYVMDITEVPMANGRGVSDADIDKLLRSKKWVKQLKGNGDFRSAECVDYLQQADIVVTNPPFSIAREFFIPLLYEYNKKFLIVGDLNWTHYKTIFPRIRNNEMWTGYNSIKEFIQPNGTTKKFGNKLWYTNLDIKKRHEFLVLYRNYCEKDYPKYINYDAIDVSKVSDIPCDYYGKMGVPDTFLEQYNPKQFEIIGLAESNLGVSIGFSANLSKEEKKALKKENPSFRQGNPIYRDAAGVLKKPFSRIIIRRKETNK